MTPRRASVAVLALALMFLPTPGLAASAVFDGDPVNATTGLPYEILPGKPLVRPGADGLLGTADDVVDTAIIGDVDLVVRAGALPAAAVIPPPALATGTAPTGVAGSRSAGGTEIPFTVFLSDGETGAGRPAGHLLAAADMDGMPVIVAAFADLDGDGTIGLTTHDAVGGSDLPFEVRELEPVGRAAALFSGGVARGSIAVRAGMPASQGGLTIALVALALTGPFDPTFFAGAIPSGPGITTALPFLPQRDLTRMIRDRAVPAGPNTTLQELVQFAAVPAPNTYALALDGSEPTIDGAVVTSQPAVRVSFRDSDAYAGSAAPLDHLFFGIQAPAAILRVRMLPVDRFENPADPPPDFSVVLHSDDSLRVLGQRGLRRGQSLRIRSAAGRRVLGRLASGVADGATGALRVEREGVVLATLPYAVDARIVRRRPDVTVPSAEAKTIQAAVDAATDRNHDGVVTVGVLGGLYREQVVIARPLELIGDGSDRTLIAGDGTATIVSVTGAGVIVHGIGAIGGGTGFNMAGAAGQLRASAAWRNVGTGVRLSGSGDDVWDSSAAANGGDGIHVDGSASGARCRDTLLRGNAGAGATVDATTGVELLDDLAVDNNAGGLVLIGAGAPVVRGNRSAGNVGSGVQLIRSSGAMLADNVCTLNDEDGLQMDRSDDAVVSGNTFDDNNGYGVFFRRSTNGDFAATPGLQPPPGDNAAAGNRKGDVFVRTD